MNTQFRAHDRETHAEALRAFRARRRRRQVSWIIPAVVLVIVAALYGPWRRPVPTQPEQIMVASPVPAPETHTLTDEELIAKFPPGSCFIAEVNGKKILVFKDASVERQFFQ